MRPSASGLLKRSAARMLVHRYTRTPVTGGSPTPDNEVVPVPGTPGPGQPCLYQVKDVLVSDDAGGRTVSTPTLYVLPDDPLDVGARVSDILDAAGTVLLAGPLIVETMNPYAEAGASVLKAATLRGTDVRLD